MCDVTGQEVLDSFDKITKSLRSRHSEDYLKRFGIFKKEFVQRLEDIFFNNGEQVSNRTHMEMMKYKPSEITEYMRNNKERIDGTNIIHVDVYAEYIIVTYDSLMAKLFTI